MRPLAVLLLFVLPSFAQISPGPGFGRVPLFPPDLQRYFEFTTDQVASIQRLNSALQQFQMDKFTRSGRVQLEIAQETAKPTLDAMALGLRYLELEAIQREVRAQHNKTYEEIQKLLTPAQKTKLEALTAALRLQGVICAAQSQNILGVVMPANRPGGLTFTGGDASSGFASFLLGPVPFQGIPGVPGCGLSGRVITGDFQTVPGLLP
jgi:hypothetical protein